MISTHLRDNGLPNPNSRQIPHMKFMGYLLWSTVPTEPSKASHGTVASCGPRGPNPDDGHLRGKMAGFIKTTVVGGLLFLLPLVVLIIVFDKVASVLRPVVDPIAALLPFESLIGLEIPVVLSAILMIAICFVAGLIARAHIAQSFVQTIEVKLLNKVPGYNLLKDISKEISVPHNQTARKVVLVQLDDAWQLGLRIEDLTDDKHVAVFIPDSPTPQSGSVLIVSEDRIKPTNITIMQLFTCLKDRGSGISRALSKS